MASGAGLNRVGGVILTVTPNSSATATPLTTYGAVGVPPAWNGGDSGLQMAEGAFFTKWVFQLIQIGPTAPTGYTVGIYGTMDPTAYYSAFPSGQWTAEYGQNTGPGSTSVQTNSWFLLPAPSEQSIIGGTASNPITQVGQFLTCSLPLRAVRAVLTATSSAAGMGQIVAGCAP
jgi:hypothetical protein